MAPVGNATYVCFVISNSWNMQLDNLKHHATEAERASSTLTSYPLVVILNEQILVI